MIKKGQKKDPRNERPVRLGVYPRVFNEFYRELVKGLEKNNINVFQ